LAAKTAGIDKIEEITPLSIYVYKIISGLLFAVVVAIVYHLKGQKWPRVGTYRFAAIGAIPLIVTKCHATIRLV